MIFVGCFYVYLEITLCIPVKKEIKHIFQWIAMFFIKMIEISVSYANRYLTAFNKVVK